MLLHFFHACDSQHNEKCTFLAMLLIPENFGECKRSDIQTDRQGITGPTDIDIETLHLSYSTGVIEIFFASTGKDNQLKPPEVLGLSQQRNRMS